MTTASVLTVVREAGRTTLTLNRPEVRNALSSELATALGDAVLAAGADAECRYVVLRGEGGHFSAGTDLKERRTLDADGKWAQSRTLWRLVQALTSSPKAIIALVEGFCLGGGFETALACDLRLASTTARFGFPEMTLGAYPGGGAGVLLPRLIGPSAAKKLLFATSRLTAEEALGLGLVHWTNEQVSLEERLDEIGDEILRRAPLAIAAVKRVLDAGYGLSFDTAAALDMAVRRPLEASEDYQEGLTAFFEKRRPKFRGR